MAKKLVEFSPDYAVIPGESLKEFLEFSGMSLKEFSLRTGLTQQSIIRIIKGEQPITPDTANRFELVTGTPARFWNNLESQYQEQLAKLREKERLEGETEWLKIIPFKELVLRKLVEPSAETFSRVRECLKFFGVSDVSGWHEIWQSPEVAPRRSSCFDANPGAAATWIRIGELQAAKISCQAFNKSRFKEALNKIRTLTREEPAVFIPEMTALCAEAGVALALVKEFPKVPWSGASRWLSPEKAMILLNLRGKSNDLFWFSFFHEAGHILNDSKKDLFINSGDKTNPIEVRADKFAAEMLIPEKYNARISRLKSIAEVHAVAKELEISPGIVVGRFQFLTHKFKLFNSLKTRFVWS
jgi:addiction module HigA family antidote